MRAVVILALAIGLAGCTTNAPQVAGAAPIPTKPARYCDPERSTGSHIPSCRSAATSVSSEILEDMTNAAAGVKSGAD